MVTKRLTRGLLLAVLGIALVGVPGSVAAAPTRLSVQSHSAAAGVSPAVATTWMVDDDGHASPGNCNGTAAAPSRIQAAVDAAHNGDTILVCPGTYIEQVTVVGYTNLTIKSTVPFGATIRTPNILAEPYLVGIGVSTNVIFQGFRLVVLARASGCGLLDFGILTSEATGIVIRGNRIQATGARTLTGPCGYIFGIQVGEPTFMTSTSASAPSSRAVRMPSWATSPAGNVVTKSRAVVSSNLVTDFQFAGITVSGKGAFADIIGNSLHFFHVKDPGNSSSSCVIPFTSPGFVSAAERMVGVSGVSTDCLGIGIIQADAAGGSIRNNVALSKATLAAGPSTSLPPLLAGILQWNQRHEVGKSEVRNNTVSESLAGIVLLYGDGSHVSRNHISNTGIGIFLQQTQGVTVDRNASNHNGAGFGVNDTPLFGMGGPDDFGRTSSGNAFKYNNALHNDLVGHASNPDGYSTTFISCFDNTTGAGSMGTADTWTSNSGETNSSDPLGICGPAVI